VLLFLASPSDSSSQTNPTLFVAVQHERTQRKRHRAPSQESHSQVDTKASQAERRKALFEAAVFRSAEEELRAEPYNPWA